VTPPAGVSVWVQGLTRPMLTGGDLADLVTIGQVAGVGTDPAAVAAAITDGAYRDQLQELARAGAGLQEAVQAVLVQDAGAACQVLAPVFERSGGTDGWVCLPVDAHLAGDTTGTLAAARRLWAQVDRPNLMVTLPATPAGLPAISAVLADGVSVNAALACSVTGYRAVLNAVLVGLEQARRNGRDLSGIHAVASLCVCAVDAEVDHRLDALEGVSARARGQWLRRQAGIANAHLAYRAYEQALTTPRWASLHAAGARTPRPLWACTDTTGSAYPDTRQVSELVTPHAVISLHRAELRAATGPGQLRGDPDPVRGRYPAAEATWNALERLGVSYSEVTGLVEHRGVQQAQQSWTRLCHHLAEHLEPADGPAAGCAPGRAPGTGPSPVP
jgi:transaldolase